MISFKTLAALQFLIMAELTNDQIQIIDIIKCSEWRSALRMKKADSIHGWKGASVDRVNQTYGTNFELSDNDIADAINIYDGWKIRNNK